MKPVLEINPDCVDKTTHMFSGNNHIMISPAVDEEYWLFRVKLCKDQAVLGFPKCGMVGVGMAKEVHPNSNTNLPIHSNSSPEKNGKHIAQHIKCNKKYKSITIKMIEDAATLICEGVEKYCKKGERAYEC